MSDEVRAKIVKLMALGKDPRANQYESKAALGQAAYLMRKHSINEAEICARSGNKPVWKWATVLVPLAQQKSRNKKVWMGQLSVGIAYLTDTKASWKWHSEYGECIAFSGEDSDVQYAVWIAKHLRDEVTSQAAGYTEIGSRHHLTKLREDFRRGMVKRLLERMEQLRREITEALRDAVVAGETGKALVLVQNKVQARDLQFGRFSVVSAGRRSMSDSARGAGVDAGNRVGLSRPLEGGQRRLNG